MDISIIIVNYGTFNLTKNTINSILKYNYSFDYEIIVVDNASPDDSLNKLRSYFKNKVKFISLLKNNGFASGNNKGLELAKGKYTLLLNSDTIVKENTLENIYDFMEKNKDVGALGCKVLLEDERLDKACKRSFPNPRNSFHRLFHIPSKDNSKDNYNLDYLDDDEIHEIDCLTGAFMFVRSKTLKEVGFLDEKFFMYGEDIDLCYRIKKANWKIIYYGKSEITHFKGSSGKKIKYKLIYHFYKSMYLFYKKHYLHSYSIFTHFFVFSGIIILFFIKIFSNLIKRKN